MTDVFLYSGEMKRGNDLDFIDFVAEKKSSNRVLLVLTTPGGSPDAAYKIGRYLQETYEDFEIFVPGFCKSAGTLLAIAANRLVFSPYGELGPLDVQMTRTDNLAGLESGLNISEAFMLIEDRAMQTFHRMVGEITSGSGGIISFHTASHSAAEIVGALYGPIFAKIDPEEVGSRGRAMRIGEDYGARLNEKFRNLRNNALSILSQSYSSHGFVIDKGEATMLFQRVTEASEAHKELVERIGGKCRFPTPRLTIECYTKDYKELLEESGQDAEVDGSSAIQSACTNDSGEKTSTNARGKRSFNGKDTSGASEASRSETGEA